MVQKTIQAYECDICGNEAERYTISFPDGLLALDRCATHAKKVLVLRDEQGSWQSVTTPKKAAFKVSTPDDIRRQATDQ